MSKIKIKSNRVGVCPYCNGNSIEYSEVQFEGDHLFFPATCDKCGRHFEEWYYMDFSGHNVGNNGEHIAQVGLEIDYEEEQQ
jgi:hypothetical protein